MRHLLLTFVLQSLLVPLVSARMPDPYAFRLQASDCAMTNIPLPQGQIPTPAMVAKDAFCAKQLIERHAPWGTVTVFGSARTKPGSEYYELTLRFAQNWTSKYGRSYPILTGGGPGIMEAANRGAALAKGPSLGIATHFSTGKEQLNPYVTDSYLAYSFAQREADLIDYAAVIVVAPGGFGTEWEIFEALSKIQTQKKSRVALILLGPRSAWRSFYARLEHFKAMGTINPEDMAIISLAPDAERAIQMIEAKLLNRS